MVKAKNILSGALGGIKTFFGFPFYIMLHPFDGFYDMKFEKRGRVGYIFFALFFLWFSQAINMVYEGFAMGPLMPGTFNTINTFYTTLAIFILFCVGNWSITSIMDGEGKFVEIAMAIAYALTPMLITIIPTTILGRFLTAEEKPLYDMINGLAWFYFILLSFIGILTVHNFTVAKTVGTIILTLVAVVIICFLGALLITLIQQVQTFINGLITEMRYRT